MLGCQDFCGYYDWTFHYVRRNWGNDALQTMLADAIGGESQAHYLNAALSDRLRGLLHVWDKTGEDEHCDWTFRLDESRNVLRWDMRQCPSKGFLLSNDLNADEDYCDHCMGWIVPLLSKAGVEVAAHEHNHCGQCWAELRIKGKPFESIADRPDNIRTDPRWQRGYVDRWTDNVKQPRPADSSGLVDTSGPADSADSLLEHFARVGCRVVTGSFYAAPDSTAHGPIPEPTGVVVDDWTSPAELSAIANRLNATPPARRPLILRAFFPTALAGTTPAETTDHFASAGLSRATPILPLLIRAGVYRHTPGATPPDAERLARLLTNAVEQCKTAR